MTRRPRLAAFLVLIAVAQAHPSWAGKSAASAKSAAKTKDGEETAPKKAADAKSKEAGALANLSQAQVSARLGAPDLVHAEGEGALWTYRLEHCALMVAFKQTPKGERATAAFAGVRRRGDTPLSLAACIAEGETRQHAVETAKP